MKKTEEEEAQIKNEDNQMMQESENEHGALAQRLVNIKDLYHPLTELEQDLMDLIRQGDRMPPKRRTRFAEAEANPRDRIEAVITLLGNHRDHL